MTTLLIDADGVAFQAASAVQRGILWDDDTYTLHADRGEAQDKFLDLIDSIQEAVSPDAEIILCYSCPSRRYFRHDLLPTYKGNRKDMPPLALRDLKAWSSIEFNARTKPGLEADDVLGILATHPKLIPGEKIVVSVDKDLDQIPGLHLNPRALDEGVYRVNPDYAERLLWTQVLTGDQTDNYSGLPSCGPKSAEKILDVPAAEYEAAVTAAYLKKGLTVEDMAVQVNVARILHHTHYNFRKKEPVLWQPKKALS